MNADKALNVLIQPDDLTKATDQAAPGHSELGQALDETAHVAAPGMTCRALFELASGPVDAARAMGDEFELVKKQIEETNVELDKMGVRAALAFSSIKANLFDAIRQEAFSEAFSAGNVEPYFKKIVARANQAHQANAAVAATAVTRAQTEVEKPATAKRDQAIAGQIPADTSVRQSDQQLLMLAAFASAGTQLNRAITAIEAGAKDLGSFAGQVQQLGKVVAGFNVQLAELRQQMAELAHKQNQPQAQ